MVDADLLSSKFRELSRRLVQIRRHCAPDAASLAANPDALDLVSFNLMLAVQACLDIASHLIADQHWLPAESLGEAFERLGERGVLTRATTEALRGAAGLRNIVAHGYEGPRADLIHAAATDGIRDLERFAAEVSSWVRSQR